MIRINLLPAKRAKRREASQRQLVYMGGAVLLALGGIVFFHIEAANELEGLQRGTRRLKADIEQLKKELGDYDKVKAQREELIKQRKSIEALNAARTGPVFLLREMSEILTPGKGPTFDRVAYEEALRRDPNVGFNASWDTRRVWLESFEEQQRRVRIRGAAKSTEDAAEFMKRLQSSVFFKNVRPESGSQVQSGATGPVKHQTFNLTAEVLY